VLSPQFKRYLVSAGIFSLAYFSFGFLLLHPSSAFYAAAGLSLAAIAVFMVLRPGVH
jgi:hypothetical protein